MADSRDNPDTEPDADEEDGGEDGAQQPATQLPSSSRQQRNKAEKQRRDKLNNYITELAALVPMVSASPKRLDKTSILRLSATYLRMSRCSVLSADGYTKENMQFFSRLWDFLQDMDGFLLVVDATGKILVVTDTVEKLLGHSQNELLGHSLFSFTAPDQQAELRRQLTPDGETAAPAAAAAAPSPGGGSGDDSLSSSDSGSSARSSPPPAPAPAAAQPQPSPAAVSPAGAGAGPGPGSEPAGGGSGSGSQRQRRSFVMQLSQRAVSRGDAAHYEPVLVQGYLHVPGRPAAASAGTPARHGRKPREPPAPSPGDIVLVAVVQQYREKRITDLSLLEATRDEYVTRHFRDGRIVYSDHRISVVAGYLAEEVSGLSAFQFMHKEDVNFTVVALQQMYDLGEGAGGSAYRLLAKTGQYIYLRTQGYLEFNKESGEVDSLICINTLLTDEEGERLVQEMKARYTASIAKCHQITRTGGPLSKAVAVEFPQQPMLVGPEALPALPSPGHLEEAAAGAVSCYPQPGPSANPEPLVSPGHSGAARSPSQQFSGMVLYSPPAPVPQPPQPSPPAAMYPGVITGPAGSLPLATAPSAGLDRPTVLRTQSVITERVTVLAAGPAAPTDPTSGRAEPGDGARWAYKEVSVLKRAFSLDSDASSSKRLHTSSGRAVRMRSRRTEVPVAAPVPLHLQDPLCVEVPPALSPEQQHQALLARGVLPPPPLPTAPPSYRPQWPPASPPPPPSPPCFPVQPAPPLLSPGSGIGDPDPDFSALALLPDADDLLGLDVAMEAIKPEFMPLEALQETLAEAVSEGSAGDLVLGEMAGPVPADLEPAGAVAAVVQQQQQQQQQQHPQQQHQQAYSCVDRELERHHLQLESRMALQQTQMSRLEQDLETVPLSDQPLRSTLSQLQAQHKKQQQMLNTLKQDHHCLQRQDKLPPSSACLKQDLGV